MEEREREVGAALFAHVRERDTLMNEGAALREAFARVEHSQVLLNPKP